MPEKLTLLKDLPLRPDNIIYVYKEDWDEIQMKLKALKIIKEKGVCVALLKSSNSVKSYNDTLKLEDRPEKDLTQEEFNLLKEVLL